MRDRFVIFQLLVAFLTGIMIGSFELNSRNKSNLLRFCMTHSISLEQCKIPEKGK